MSGKSIVLYLWQRERNGSSVFPVATANSRFTAPERLDFGIEGAKFREVDEDGLDGYEFIGGERERERWEEPTT